MNIEADSTKKRNPSGGGAGAYGAKKSSLIFSQKGVQRGQSSRTVQTKRQTPSAQSGQSAVSQQTAGQGSRRPAPQQAGKSAAQTARSKPAAQTNGTAKSAGTGSSLRMSSNTKAAQDGAAQSNLRMSGQTSNLRMSGNTRNAQSTQGFQSSAQPRTAAAQKRVVQDYSIRNTAPAPGGTVSYNRDLVYSRPRTISKSKTNLILGIIGIILAAGLLIAYLVGMVIYNGKFLPNTFVNGVEISGLDFAEASKAILEDTSSDGIIFVKKDGERVQFTGDQFGSVVSIPEGGLNEAASESHALWFTKLFTYGDYTVNLNSTYSEEQLRDLIMNYPWGSVSPTNAEITQDDSGQFVIRPEDNGNMIDPQKLADFAVNKLRSGNNEVSLEAADCYLKADVVTADLVDTLALYNSINSVNITFDMTNRETLFDPAGTEYLDHTTIVSWLIETEDDLKVDTEKAKEWIRANIADKYDTYVTGYTRMFHTTMDGSVEMPLGTYGTYGWETDIDATADHLVETIRKGQSATIEPVYSKEGFRMSAHGDYEDYDYTGSTYIEVSKERQHMWVYIDGALALESDVVTGEKTDTDRETPSGVYSLWLKATDIVLGTYEVQGYEQPVAYWMAITYNGIGLHDLERQNYGGSTYVNNGSHGCINLPLDVAKQVYEMTPLGIPVIVTPD